MACRVEDSGIGIAKEDQDQLFKIFGKLQNLSEVSTSGIGLGLHICKQLCDSLGGDIQLVHSQKGQGSTFIFHIPTQGPSVEGEDNIDEKRKRKADWRVKRNIITDVPFQEATRMKNCCWATKIWL